MIDYNNTRKMYPACKNALLEKMCGTELCFFDNISSGMQDGKDEERLS
jgi:hypothetical protein